MANLSIKTIISKDIQTVWEKVTDVRNYGWRSDLSRTEVLNEKKFIEYTKDGFPTVFTVTAFQPFSLWEFDIDNDNIKGHWKGVFTESDGNTEIVFTEEVSAKKFLMKPFVKAYLKKQQALFVSDLKKALS